MRSKLTYANVTATLALFLALGGSSYAVVQFTGRNVKDGSLTTKDVKNRSLLRKVRRGQLEAGSKGDTGDRGPQGVQGEAGSAAAYASADGDGTLIESKNVDRIARGGFGSPTVGYYCLHTTVTPHNVVATVKGRRSRTSRGGVLPRRGALHHSDRCRLQPRSLHVHLVGHRRGPGPSC